MPYVVKVLKSDVWHKVYGAKLGLLSDEADAIVDDIMYEAEKKNDYVYREAFKLDEEPKPKKKPKTDKQAKPKLDARIKKRVNELFGRHINAEMKLYDLRDLRDNYKISEASYEKQSKRPEKISHDNFDKLEDSF